MYNWLPHQCCMLFQMLCYVVKHKHRPEDECISTFKSKCCFKWIYSEDRTQNVNPCTLLQTFLLAFTKVVNNATIHNVTLFFLSVPSKVTSLRIYVFYKMNIMNIVKQVPLKQILASYNLQSSKKKCHSQKQTKWSQQCYLRSHCSNGHLWHLQHHNSRARRILHILKSL